MRYVISKDYLSKQTHKVICERCNHDARFSVKHRKHKIVSIENGWKDVKFSASCKSCITEGKECLDAKPTKVAI